MNKTLSRKFIYVITVLALLAMMVPAMVVSAAPNPTLTMTVAGVTDGNGTRAFNISGTIVTITASEAPTAWNLSNITTMPGYAPAAWYPSTPADNATVVQVIGIWGEANITATFAGDPNPVTVSVNKKWGMIDHTVISPSGSQYVTWNEATKSWFAEDNITDTVYADFIENGAETIKVAQGTVLDWYLVSGLVDAAPKTGYAPDLNTWALGLADAQYTQFVSNPGPKNMAGTGNGWNGTHIQTISGVDGSSTVNIGAWFEENVQIIVVPSYPNNPNKMVTSEMTSYNFGTREMEVVPQVRWAGEKIVLEANFGLGSSGDVKFFLQNTSVGTLEGMNDDSEQSTVWAELDDNGTASVILTSGTNGQADVSAALYANGEDGPVTNQMAFRVYFLNFESIKLTDVNGKRDGHNMGLWTPENPYNENFPAGVAANDLEEVQTLNVSQDALERVQVRGWFVPPAGAQMSTRPLTEIDLDGDGVGDVAAPQGRWVLPDDWAKLAGFTNWKERRIHWDIMSAPTDASGVLSVANSSLGDYMQGPKEVSEANVIGPFAPGLEVMTPSGWMIPNPRLVNDTDVRNTIQTVVPDGLLDAWDAPMPPAKIILEVMAGPGFFKDAMKTDIYYHKVGANIFYTNPFYQILIPANPLIPAFNQQAGGGYDWNSYDGTHGPYQFWTIINQPDMNAITPGDAMHPTKIEIYSDNHGEAMAWLNGDWNLDLGIYTGKGGADVPVNEVVGTTTVQASADYPYIRNDQAIFSTTVEKVWFWSGQVLGTDGHDFGTNPVTGQPIGTPTSSSDTLMVLTAGNYMIDNGTPAEFPNQFGFSNDKVVWVWATDRDGLISGVLGTKVQWHITGDGAFIPAINANQISNYNWLTQHIYITNGFISFAPNTPTGNILNPDRTMAESWLRVPNQAEKQLFYKKWGTGILGANGLYDDPTGMAPINFAVAAIDIINDSPVDCTVSEILTGPDFGYPGQTLGNVFYSTNVDFSKSYPIDDPIIAGDANADGEVNAADITAVERIIMGIASPNSNADVDSNGSVDMGDVVKINNIILKIK